MYDVFMVNTHSYAIWGADTEVTLCNVPWDSEYRDVVRFSSPAALDAYIDSLPTEDRKVISEMSYIRAFDPVFVEDPFNTVNQYNYIRVRQPGQETTPKEPSKTFYYFVTEVRHVAPNTTALTLQLDVWQSFIYDTKIGRAYVERGHIGIANANANDNYGRDYLTVNEGLDLGSEYTYRVTRNVYLDTANGSEGSMRRHLLVYSSISLAKDDLGDADDPDIKVPTPQQAFGATSQVGVYVSTESSAQLLNKLKDYAWAAQGVFAMFEIPALDSTYQQTSYGAVVNSDLGLSQAPFGTPYRQHSVYNSWRDGSAVLSKFGGRYRRLTKFYTAPYMFLELDLMDGNSVQIRPEMYDDDGLDVRVEFSGVLGALGYYVYPYKTGTENDQTPYNGMHRKQLHVSSTAVVRVPVVNDSAAVAQAASMHSRQYAKDSAAWAQRKAGMSTDLSENLAEAQRWGMGESNRIQGNQAIEQNQLQRDYNEQQAWTNGIASTGTGVIGGLMTGGPGGALAGGLAGAGAGVLGGIRTAQQNEQMLKSLNVGLNYSGQSTELAQGLNKSTTDANARYARAAARGDYQNTIAGIEAAYRDTEMTPPSVLGQTDNNFFAVAYRPVLRCAVRFIQDSAMRKIGEFWLTYGYAVNSHIRSLPDDMMVMQKFTYWKLTSTYIKSARMPETFKNTIRGIFEKGVTVWRTPGDIGFVDVADNAPIVKEYY